MRWLTLPRDHVRTTSKFLRSTGQEYGLPGWRNRQTRQTQNLVLAREWEFDPPSGHQRLGVHMNRAQRRRQEKLQAKNSPLDSGRKVHALLAQGMGHHKEGRFNQAESLYQQALQIVPDHPEAHHLLGLAAYHLGDFEKAMTLLLQAIAYAPRNGIYHYNLGIVWQKLGRIQEAKEAFQKAVTLNSNHAEAWSSLGHALTELGDHDQAVESLQKAIRVNPRYAEAIIV